MFTTVIKMILQTCSKMVLSNREGITRAMWSEIFEKRSRQCEHSSAD